MPAESADNVSGSQESPLHHLSNRRGPPPIRRREPGHYGCRMLFRNLGPERSYFTSFVIASAALPATTQLADPATTASSSNQRNPKSSINSGKSGLMMMYPGINAPGMYALSARLLLYVFV